MDFDYIVVGGGSAGCVMAGRISEKSANRVLLCEAGQDTVPGEEPEDILDSYPGYAFLNTRYHWPDVRASVSRPHIRSNDITSPQLRTYEQARVLGGGSAINGQIAFRGLPSDYDDWDALGAEGWNWSAVLPYFIKCEHDHDFNGPLHGQSGPLDIMRMPLKSLSGHAVQISQALKQIGLPLLQDHNAEFSDGHFPLALTNYENHRVTTAMAYLPSSVRSRPNLKILTDTIVTSLLFDDRKCIGIRAKVAGEEREFRANEVILSSGAIHSPAHLLRSGIGPGDHLRALGMKVRVDLPGVGRRMLEHPLIGIASYLFPKARIKTRRHHQLGMRMSSGLPGIPQGDLSGVVTSKTAWHAVGNRIGATLLALNRVYSETGFVELTAPDFGKPLSIHFNLLDDWRDLERLKIGFRRIATLYDVDCVRSVVSDPFAASYSERVRTITYPTLFNKALAGAASSFLDGPAWVRTRFMNQFVVEGATLAELLNSDELLTAFIRKKVTGGWHVSSTCRMGRAEDKMAVTDKNGRVHGVGGLRVCDTSIFPTIPSANLNLPAIMSAEKISDGILKGEA